MAQARSRHPSAPPGPAGAAAPEAVELTILMPCLNEAETIETCVRKAMGFLERSGVVGEVLVSDNGSTDGSQMLAMRAGARVVTALEKGYGAALLAGVAEAHGRYVIMGDGDDSYDLANLDGMVEALRGGAELVMGNRFAGGIEPGAMPPLHRYLGNPVLSFIGRLLFRVPIGDFHCGLRGFDRAAIERLALQSPGMEFASEMVVKASLHGLKIAEVPTTLRPDGRSRAPHLRTWRDGWRHLRFLLLHSPRWLFLYPGLALTLLGLGGMAILAGGPARLTPTIGLDIHTMTAACFAVVLGSQLMVFGALARRYGVVEGFLPSSEGLKSFLLGMDLETLLLLALGILVCGVGGVFWATGSWVSAGMGAIQDFAKLRLLLASLTAICVAVQIGAAGFFGSILTIRRRA